MSARRSRLVFTTARTLHERHRGLNPSTHLVRNVGDHTHFLPAADRSFAAAEVGNLPRPVIGFAGNITTGLPELEGMGPDVTLAGDSAHFVGLVEDALGRLDVPSRDRRIGIAAGIRRTTV